MKKQIIVFSVLFLLYLLFITGCGDSGTTSVTPTATPTPIIQTITSAGGGTITVSNGNVTFPANSVNKGITVTGEIVSVTPNLPAGMEGVGSVYKFTLSDPNAYVANTASITLPINGSTTGAVIFISDNNSTYTGIGGTVSGSNVTAKVPHFSYFVVARPLTSTGTPVWSTEVKVNGGDDARRPSIVVDPNGNAYAAFEDEYGSTEDIYFTNCPSNGNWGANVKVSNTSNDLDSAGIGMDSSGNAYLTWAKSPDPNNYTSRDILFSYRPSGGSWSSNSIIASGGNYFSPKLAVDPSGNGYLVWTKESFDPNNLNNDISFSYRPSGGNWTASSTIASGVFYDSPSIAVDSSGNAYLVWRDSPADANTPANIYFSYRPSGGNWTASSIIASGQYYQQPDMAVDSSGNAYLVWVEAPSAYDPNTSLYNNIHFSYRPTGGNWTAGSFIASGPNYFHPSITVDSSGNAYVIWRDSTGNDSLLFSYKQTGGAWNSAVRIDDGTATSIGVYGLDIAADPSGKFVYAIWSARKNGIYGLYSSVRK